jgi:hypothetical protein
MSQASILLSKREQGKGTGILSKDAGNIFFSQLYPDRYMDLVIRIINADLPGEI